MQDVLLELVPGDDWAASIAVRDEAGPVDLTGWTIVSSSVAWRGGSVALAASWIDASAGTVALAAARAATGKLPFGLCSTFRLVIRSPADFQETVVYGLVKGVFSTAGNEVLAQRPGVQGPVGQKGWAPILAVQADGARRVLAVVGWTGGEGAAPATGGYLGPGGIVTDITQAGDIRGATGATGATGLTGATGAQGAQGNTGATGAQGATGPAGTTTWAGLSGKPTTLSGYGITDAAPAANPSITGTLTQTANSGTLLYSHVMPNGGGYGFRLYGTTTPWTNGPAGDANYQDDVWAFGLNMAGIGVKADNAKQYAAWHIESKFYGDSSQPSPYTELHFQVLDVAGVNHRPISGAFRHDGLYAGLQFAFSVTTLADYAGTQRISYDFTSSSINQVYHQVKTQYQFGVNNVPIAGQRNASDTAYLNMPYIGSDDRLILGNALSAIGSTPSSGSYANTHARLQSTNLAAGGILLNAVTPAVTGDTILVQAVGQNTGESIVNVFNNTAAGGNAVVELRVLDGSSGDPHIRFKVNGSTSWRFGLDNSNADSLVWGTSTLGAADKMVLDTSGNLSVTGYLKPAGYTVGTVPSASAAGAGAQIFVSNESGGAVMAFSDGTNWRRVTDRAVIS